MASRLLRALRGARRPGMIAAGCAAAAVTVTAANTTSLCSGAKTVSEKVVGSTRFLESLPQE